MYSLSMVSSSPDDSVSSKVGLEDEMLEQYKFLNYFQNTNLYSSYQIETNPLKYEQLINDYGY